MATGAGRLHCTWCGEVVTGGRRFCAACGKPVVEPEVDDVDEDDEDDEEDYDDLDYTSTPVVTRSYYRAPRQSTAGLNTEPEQSQSFLSKLAGVAAFGIIPLGLIMMVITSALPILVVVALFIGPGDTWSMVRAWIPGSGGESGNAACEGFEAWYDSSNERASRFYKLIEPLQRGEVQDLGTVRTISHNIETLAAQQQRSLPPPAAEELNDSLLALYNLFAKETMAAANGDAESLRAYEAMHQFRASQVEAADARVRETCL